MRRVFQRIRYLKASIKGAGYGHVFFLVVYFFVVLFCFVCLSLFLLFCYSYSFYLFTYVHFIFLGKRREQTLISHCNTSPSSVNNRHHTFKAFKILLQLASFQLHIHSAFFFTPLSKLLGLIYMPLTACPSFMNRLTHMGSEQNVLW